MSLPAVGELSYDTYTWDAFTDTKVRITPVLDEARRALKFNRYEITADGYVSNGGGTDNSLSNMRKILTAPARTLTYTNKGLGTIKVGPNGPIIDVCYGPIPELLEFKPLGGSSAAGNVGAKVKWSVTTCFPDCVAGSASYQGQIMAMTFEQSWSISDEGWTTRTITGSIEIPANRTSTSARTINDQADAYREKLTPATIYGFTRRQDWKLSRDQKILSFTIIDTEIPIPYPDGVAKATCSHTIEAAMGQGGFKLWRGTIEANLTMAQNAPTPQTKATAWDRFLLIVRSRLGAVKNGKFDLAKVANAPDATCFMTGLKIRENVFGYDSSFSLSYILGGVGLDKILGASKLWTPIAGTAFNSWSASMANIYGPRGNAGLKADKSDVAIMDLCIAAKPKQVQEKPTVTNPKKGKVETQPKVDQVKPEKSWIQFTNDLVVIWKNNVARQKPIQDFVIQGGGAPVQNIKGDHFYRPKGTTPPDSKQTSYDTQGQPPEVTTKPAVSDIFQTTSAPTTVIVMRGSCVRIQHRTDPPELKSVGGQDTVVKSYRSGERVLFGIDDTPVYQTWWDIEYWLGQPPSGALPSMSNPQFDVDGGTAGIVKG